MPAILHAPMAINNKLNRITGEVIGAAIEVHRHLGPGLLERPYRECLSRELSIRRVPHYLERPLPVEYKGYKLGRAYSIDLLVEDSVVIEVKSVESLAPVHEAQLITYLSLGGWKVGLLINFNVEVLKNGVRRKVLNFKD